MGLDGILKDDTLALNDEDFLEFNGFRVAFANVTQDPEISSFRLVVRPSYVSKEKIISVVFKAQSAPEYISIECFHRGDRDLWTFTWKRKESRQIEHEMNRPFATYMDEYFTPGWRHIEAVGRARRHYGFTKPYYELGGRTPQQMFAIGNGAYEVTGIGFVWVGTLNNSQELQWCQYLPWEQNNSDIRIYLSRGANIQDAYRMTIDQWDFLLPQFLSAFGSVMRGNMRGISGAPGKGPAWAVDSLKSTIDTAQDIRNRLTGPAEKLAVSLGVMKKQASPSSPDDLWDLVKKPKSTGAQARIVRAMARPYRQVIKLGRLAAAAKEKKTATRFGTIVRYLRN